MRSALEIRTQSTRLGALGVRAASGLIRRLHSASLMLNSTRALQYFAPLGATSPLVNGGRASVLTPRRLASRQLAAGVMRGSHGSSDTRHGPQANFAGSAKARLLSGVGSPAHFVHSRVPQTRQVSIDSPRSLFGSNLQTGQTFTSVTVCPFDCICSGCELYGGFRPICETIRRTSASRSLVRLGRRRYVTIRFCRSTLFPDLGRPSFSQTLLRSTTRRLCIHCCMYAASEPGANAVAVDADVCGGRALCGDRG